MIVLSRLFDPIQHCEDAVIALIRELNIKVTKTSILNDVREHQDYPSLLAIKDAISNYGVLSIPLKINSEGFSDLYTPFIVNLKSEKLDHDIFGVVKEVTEERIKIYNPEISKDEVLSHADFNKKYKGYALAVEAEEDAQEDDFKRKLRAERKKIFFLAFSLFAFPLITIVACIYALSKNSLSISIAPVIFTLTTLFGGFISILLLWHEIDEYNPVAKQICYLHKKVNCSAVLNSKFAKVLGISWSTLGFTYFGGILLTLISNGIVNPPILQVVSWINLLALPYIIYSIYYQYFVIKQWCVLCITILLLLLIQFIAAFWGDFYAAVPFSAIPRYLLISIWPAFILIFITTSILMPALAKANQSRQKTVELNRLKLNPDVFKTLLSKQKPIVEDLDGLGITIGNTNGRYEIVKVCNPYCTPCAKAHSVLEELLESSEQVSIRIIFTATNNEGDIRKKPVAHLLAINENTNAQLIKEALKDWYEKSPQGTYESFAAQYPLNAELLEQDEKIRNMSEWCSRNEISFTPTFYINGYRLPEMYALSDLKYIFNANKG